MQDRGAPEGYSRAQVWLHWLIAVLVIVQLTINEEMQRAFRLRAADAPGELSSGALFHIVVGLTILALAALRFAIRATRGVPDAHAKNPPLVNLVGHVAHLLLYGFLFAMPLTGALAWFAGIELSAQLHEMGRLVLIPLIAAHALGALAEHYVFGTNSLLRMIGVKGSSR